MDNKQTIQWFPGHMAKTKRKIKEILPLIDAVAEVVDARIPVSSRNPDLEEIIENKPHIILLNKCDMADSRITKQWIEYYKKNGITAIALDCKSGKGINQFKDTVKTALAHKLEAYREKGMVGKPLRVMVVGIPNVGKSSFINKIAGKTRAKAENRPGVTRGKQWVTVDAGLQLLDTPGILWPKFEDPEVGMMLAYTGAVKEGVIDLEELSCRLMELLHKFYPQTLLERYKVEAPEGTPGWELLEMAGRKRGFLLARGEINTERMAKVLIDEFRSGKLGKFTLEMPEATV